jgi:branched-chain amino acid transport system substrate-binding protein
VLGSHGVRRARRLVLLLAALAAGVAVVGCGSGGSGGTNASSTTSSKPGTPFKVLVIWPRSGPAEAPGTEELNGLQSAVNVINGEGGILGHKVQLKVVDDAADGTKAVTAAQKELASGAKYNLIIPGIAGSDAVPLAAALAKNPTLQVSTASEDALNDPAKYPNLYMTGTGFAANEEGMAAEMKADGVKKIGIIAGDDPSGHNAVAALQKAAATAGIKVTTTVLVPDTAVDATPQMQKVLASHPDAIASGAFSTATPAIVKARAKLAVSTPLYGDAFFSAANLGAIAKPPELKGIKVQSFPYLVAGNAAQQTPEYKAFAAQMAKLQPHPPISLIAGIVAYNALMVTRGAANKAKSVDGATLAKTLSSISNASEVPGFVGAKDTGIFTPTQHILQVTGKNFIFVKAGPQVDGILHPSP